MNLKEILINMLLHPTLLPSFVLTWTIFKRVGQSSNDPWIYTSFHYIYIWFTSIVAFLPCCYKMIHHDVASILLQIQSRDLIYWRQNSILSQFHKYLQGKRFNIFYWWYNYKKSYILIQIYLCKIFMIHCIFLHFTFMRIFLVFVNIYLLLENESATENICYFYFFFLCYII